MEQTRGYQFDFSEILPEALYDREARKKKAKRFLKR
jgi:hypothetical protein